MCIFISVYAHKYIYMHTGMPTYMSFAALARKVGDSVSSHPLAGEGLMEAGLGVRVIKILNS